MAVKVDTICGVFDKRRREQLRKHYDLAAKETQETFRFEGHLYLTNFAKYLLQYLDAQL